jgi:hypothetical protein
MLCVKSRDGEFRIDTYIQCRRLIMHVRRGRTLICQYGTAQDMIRFVLFYILILFRDDGLCLSRLKQF